MLALASATIVRSFEFLSLRGAPTILHMLEKIPALQRQMGTAKLRGGQTIRFPAFDSYWCRFVWANVPYEEDVAQIFRKIARGRVLVDCGANIGYWSVRAPEFGFTEVIAIEANRDLVPILRENFHLNHTPGVVHHAAVYSQTGQQLFLERTEDHAAAGIGEKGMPVSSITIADAVKDVPSDREIVVKLDVEGAEISAFKGAESLHNAIFVYEDFVRLGMPVTSYLLERGMAVFGVSEFGRQGRVLTPEDGASFTLRNASPRTPTNLVACRPEKAAQLEAQLARGE
jgi:FkbM family methyltransferase